MELKMKGNPIHLIGEPIKIGTTLGFQAIDSQKGLVLVNFSSIRNNKKIIVSVPSLDTGVCALETQKFNEYAASNLKDYELITISKDLPFAQNRFCESLKLNSNFHIWSDYRNQSESFGLKTNLLIKENELLARAILIVNENNEVIYQQIVPEVGQEPDYQAIIDFLK